MAGIVLVSSKEYKVIEHEKEKNVRCKYRWGVNRWIC